MQTLFNAPYPLKLNRPGRWVMSFWVAFQGLLFVLALIAWFM